jgi:HlyD family secretion protein
LASDQATIDSDQASLVSAQQSLGNGSLAAPIAGTVATVHLSVGQAVNAGASSDAITIIDPGGYQTTSSLTSTQVGEVAVGDRVQVTVDGQTGTYSGTVTRVGPVDVSSSSYSYPLVVALSDGSLGSNTAVAGSTAQVAVDVAEASHSVIVPSSAVHTTSAGNSYVMALQSGREVRTQVKVGVVGDIYTQITSGLPVGTHVVLADPSQAVPSSSTNSSNTFRGIGGAGGTSTGFPRFARSATG